MNFKSQYQRPNMEQMNIDHRLSALHFLQFKILESQLILAILEKIV
jgi:hypothetical protein